MTLPTGVEGVAKGIKALNHEGHEGHKGKEKLFFVLFVSFVVPFFSEPFATPSLNNCHFTHASAFHAELLIKMFELDKNLFQIMKIHVRVSPKVMGVPPQVVEQAIFSRVLHLASDALQRQGVT